MKSNIPTYKVNDIPFEKFFEELCETEKWLNSLGARTINNRFEEIKVYIQILVEEYIKFKKNNKNCLSTLGDEVEYAGYEGDSLIAIKNCFNKLDKQKIPIKKIKKILNGPFKPTDENSLISNTEARDLLFELNLAVHLNKYGINITGYEDVNFNIDKYEVSIQCKRPSSDNGIKEAIEKAYSQLIENNEIDGKNKLGIVAISLEKLYNLDRLLYIKDLNELNNSIDNILRDFKEKNYEFLIPFLNKKAIAYILYYKSNIVFEDKIMRNVYRINLFPLFNYEKMSKYHSKKFVIDLINKQMLG